MAKKETKKENVKNKKSFFKDFKAELKKVSWPTPKQLINNTIAVITIVLITSAIVFVLDFAFEILNKNGVNKIKEIVETRNSTTENVENETTVDDAIEEETIEEEQQTTENEDNNTENNAE